MSADTIGAAYSSYAGDLRRFLYGRTRCRETAEDLAHDVFVRLSTGGHGSTIGDLRSYLFRIAHNLLIDHHRWNHRKTAPTGFVNLSELTDQGCEPPSPDPSAEDLLDLQDQVRRLEQSLAHLSETCRRVLWLSRGLGLRNREIATLLGVCDSTVEKSLAKALSCCQRPDAGASPARLGPRIPARAAAAALVA